MDSLMLGPIRVAQLVSIIGIIAGFILFFYNIKKSTPQDPRLYSKEVEPAKVEGINYIKKR